MIWQRKVMPSFEMGTMWSAVNPVPNRACIFLLLRLKKRLASTDGAEARRMPRALFPMLFRMWWLKQNGLQTERCLYRHPALHPSERRMRRDLFKPSRCRPGRTFHLVGGVVVNRITFYNTNFPHANLLPFGFPKCFVGIFVAFLPLSSRKALENTRFLLLLMLLQERG